MFRKLKKMMALAASLALAGGTMAGTPASAQSGCWEQVMNQCEVSWPAWGLTGYSDCAPLEACQVCPETGGANCPAISWLDPSELARHDSHGH